MIGALTKKLPTVAAMVFAAITGYANYEVGGSECCNCHQGYALDCNELPVAYNAPARIDVRCPVDMFATGSFIFWQPREEGVELATLQSEDANGNLANSTVKMDFDYKPGFKVGLGVNFDCDNWTLYGEYTRLISTMKASKLAGSGESLFSHWDAVRAASSEVSARWKLEFNMGDLKLSRPYYVGNHLIFKPFVGVRGVWIEQNYKNSSSAALISEIITSNSHIRSWAVGPRFGMDTNWILTDGLRFFGNVGGSLLFQQFKSSVKSSDSTDIKDSEDIGFIVPNADMALGFGWGSYFDRCNWHIDISAAYELQVFMHQNMMRHLLDQNRVSVITDAPAIVDGGIGDLMFHGLTVTVSLDF